MPGSFADLDDLYRRWCASVPFDPTTKALALRRGEVPPGDDPVAFLEQWLTTGVGGLCWPHVTALASLFAAAGVEVSIGLDRMLRDDRVDFHAFVVVHDAGRRFAADTVHLSDRLVPMEPGCTGEHAHYGSGFEQAGERLVHWFVHPERPDHRVDYVVLSTVLDLADVRAFCELSVTHSGIGVTRFYHRSSPAGGFLMARPDEDGGRLVDKRWRADGEVTTATIAPVEGLQQLGYEPSGIALIERSGLLEGGPSPRFT